MKSFFLAAILGLLSSFNSDTNNFIAEQRKFPRVNAAYNQAEAVAETRLDVLHLDLENINLLLAAYKTEKELDVFVKSPETRKYQKLITFKICALSGQPGPKREQGDFQIPEGFYEINRFHPESKYHLALGLNYPNQADRIVSKAAKLGGDIFIHGNCVTIGCLPMTDSIMEELYLYAINAYAGGQQNIPVYLFPFRLSTANLEMYSTKFKASPEMKSFWKNLKTGYDSFQSNSEAVNVAVASNGTYVFE